MNSDDAASILKFYAGWVVGVLVASFVGGLPWLTVSLMVLAGTLGTLLLLA